MLRVGLTRLYLVADVDGEDEEDEDRGPQGSPQSRHVGVSLTGLPVVMVRSPA